MRIAMHHLQKKCQITFIVYCYRLGMPNMSTIHLREHTCMHVCLCVWKVSYIGPMRITMHHILVEMLNKVCWSFRFEIGMPNISTSTHACLKLPYSTNLCSVKSYVDNIQWSCWPQFTNLCNDCQGHKSTYGSPF